MYMPTPARVPGAVAAAVFFACVSLGTPALSAELYVSTSGNDSSGTGTLQNPYRTVKRAISLGRAGDTITLRAPANNRTYNECDVRLRQKMTLQTYAGEGKARIHCAITTPDSVTIQIDPAASGSRLSNLEISGGYYYGIMLQTNWYQGGPATDTGASDVVLEDLLIHSTGRDGIKITPKSNRATIRRVEIHTTGARDNSNADGIDNVNADGMLVEDSYIHDTATTGMYFKGGARDVVVQRNRIENTGDAGILVGFDTSTEFFDLSVNPQYYESIRGIVRNNVVRNTGYSGIGMYASKDAIVANNTIVNAGRLGHSALYFGLSFQDWDQNAKRPANVNPTIRNNLVVQDGHPCVEIRWTHEEELGGALSALDGDPGMDGNGYSDRRGACRFIDQRPQTPMLAAVGDFERWQRRMGTDVHGKQAAFLLDDTGKPQAGSPAIKAGMALDAVTDDIDGAPRGDPPDLGAYETGLPVAAALPAPAPAAVVADDTLAAVRASADDAGVVARSRYAALQAAWNRFDPGISLMKFILLSLAAVALLALVLVVRLVRKRNVMGWLLAWMKQDWRAPVPEGATRHLLFCFVDHYEPAWGKPDLEKERARVARWRRDLPRLCEGHRDADGRPPVHSFFYPEEEYREEHLDALVELCRQGLGEIEIHLHHDDDTEAGLREKLSRFTELLAARHDALPRDPVSGQPRWAFIHGNWALDNSHPSGRHCGVDNELIVLREEGCYADFTLPAAPDPCQTRTVNRIHYAKDDPVRCKSHDTGPRVRVGGQQDGDLMIIQGPLGFRWKSRKFGLIPRIENSDIRKVAPPSRDRIDAWVQTGIHIEGRPEWTFVKIHTHGAEDCDMDTLLGRSMDEAHSYLESRYNDGRAWKLHYVSAREMYNLAKAAEAGEIGEPGLYRDYVIPRPAYGVAPAVSEPAMPRVAGSIG
ncbi:right-handed parallel beta-helix repeat-containing protein [Pseudoxanthomonas sp.]|uniref:right-handed parallel beta-helix repeat-containing protein n=1 Tax=Pseudoxanthomonas sp. TaxID=1871049 RepID=UPI002FE00085